MQTYIFDFDSTIVAIESLGQLAELALAGHHDREDILGELKTIGTAGTMRQIDFGESLHRRLSLFSATHEQVEQVVTKLKDNISPSMWLHREWFTENAEHIYVVSGGFRDFVEPVVVGCLGILPDHVFANDLTYDQSGAISGINTLNPLTKPHGKALQVSMLNLPRPSVVIGDGATDYDIKAQGQADVFYVFTETVSRPSVVALADKELAIFDPALLPMNQ